MEADRPNTIPGLPRLRRFACRASLAGLILAYATTIPMKAEGLLLPSVSWLGVVVVPPVILSSIPMVVILPTVYLGRRRLAFLACGACYAVAVLLIAWQGWA